MVYAWKNASLNNGRVQLENFGGVWVGDRTLSDKTSKFVPTPDNIVFLPNATQLQAAGLVSIVTLGCWRDRGRLNVQKGWFVPAHSTGPRDDVVCPMNASRWLKDFLHGTECRFQVACCRALRPRPSCCADGVTRVGLGRLSRHEAPGWGLPRGGMSARVF